MRKNLIRIRNTVSNHHIMSSFDARFINFNIRHVYQICTNETCYYISIEKVKFVTSYVQHNHVHKSFLQDVSIRNLRSSSVATKN